MDSLKRKRDEMEGGGEIDSIEIPPAKKSHVDEEALKVAKHYNQIVTTKTERNESNIFHVRAFNNWVKSVLISKFAKRFPRMQMSVLDLFVNQRLRPLFTIFTLISLLFKVQGIHARCFMEIW